MGEPSALMAAVRLLLSSLAVVAIPGVLIVLAWRPRREITVLELVAVGIATSLIAVHGLTVAAIVLHQPIGVMLVVLAVIAIAHGVVAVRRQEMVVRFPRSEWVLAGAIATIAASLYISGSPYDSTEDAIHVAIVRRLRFLDAPSLHNIYVVPNLVYTYPFPGTHYLIAAISRLSELDPLFVYHKLRALWGFAALTLLYGCARCVFASPRIALASALVATVLVANGSFAGVPNFYWGQLAPFSHASDVAMGVLLPALLLLILQVFCAQTSRETAFFMTAAAGLIVTLTMVHIREVLQCVAYLGAFLVALLIVNRDVRLLKLTTGLLVIAVVIPLAYDAWHQSIAPDVDLLVEENRLRLLGIAGQFSVRDWLRPGVAVLGGFIPAFDVFFYGWNPLVLLGAVILAAQRGVHKVALVIPASILAFVIVVRLAPVTWAYLYATYFEALYTPVRNVIFFVHLAAGAVLFVAAARIARRSPITCVGLTVATAIALVLAYANLGRLMVGYQDLLWLPLALGCVAVAWKVRAGAPADRAASTLETPRMTTAVAVALSVPAVIVSWNAASSPITGLSRQTFPTPSALMQASGCKEGDSYTVSYAPPDMRPIEVTGLLSCPPPERLMRFAESELPAQSVLAVDKYDVFSPAMFMPQQMNTWPGEGDGLLDQRDLFGPYFRFYDAAVKRHGEQPFFNTKDTDEDRSAFVQALGITHVLVNPRMHATMTALLDGLPGKYSRRYDDGRWAIYEVRK